MGQLLSREDEEEQCDQPNAEDHAAHEEKEKPRRRQRNAGAALRSRKTKPSGLGRTRRNRTNHIAFDVNDYSGERYL